MYVHMLIKYHIHLHLGLENPQSYLDQQSGHLLALFPANSSP